MKIYEQADRVAGQLEVRSDLGEVHGKQLFDGFHFDHDLSLDDQIDSVPAFQRHTSVGDWNMHLPLDCKAHRRQLMRKTNLIR